MFEKLGGFYHRNKHECLIFPDDVFSQKRNIMYKNELSDK